MPQTATSRFPTLTAPEDGPTRLQRGFGISFGLLPIPIGEIAVLLAAWLLMLHL